MSPELKAESNKPRALTYTEMMNGGRQQLDAADYALEEARQQRLDDLERDVEHLRKILDL